MRPFWAQLGIFMMSDLQILLFDFEDNVASHIHIITHACSSRLWTLSSELISDNNCTAFHCISLCLGWAKLSQFLSQKTCFKFVYRTPVVIPSHLNIICIQFVLGDKIDKFGRFDEVHVHPKNVFFHIFSCKMSYFSVLSNMILSLGLSWHGQCFTTAVAR